MSLTQFFILTIVPMSFVGVMLWYLGAQFKRIGWRMAGNAVIGISYTLAAVASLLACFVMTGV